MSRLAAASLLVALAACRGPEPDGVYGEFERMIVQPRYEAYRASDLFPDGRVMRTPPVGTAPSGAPYLDPLVAYGRAGDRYADRIPLPLTPELLALGRRRFDVVCAPCHGVLGDGASPVATNMQLRPPPSLHTPEIRGAPVGRLYAIVGEGYGLMPGYADLLSVEERWAVVAYVRALQRSQGVALDELPDALRGEALRAVGGSAPGRSSPQRTPPSR